MVVRVLHVLNNLGSGGAEAFVMNMYRNIDRTKVQFDFLIRSTKNGPMVQEIEKMGGKVFILPPFPKKIIQNYRGLENFLKKNSMKYMAIHVHANSLIYVKPLQLAKKYGIPCRIIHSHSTKSSAPIVHFINKKRIEKWVTHRFACSSMAGQWMFSKKEYQIIPNGIELDRFIFNEQARKEIRSKYELEGKTIIGNVGRFTPQKNHFFIIDVFEKYREEEPNAALMLVGDGDDKLKIIDYATKKGLKENIVFTGAVPDVWRYLSAMDVFFFPSVCEGLGISLIEAQQNGLPCIVSDRIPKESLMNENIFILPLEADLDVWTHELRDAVRIDSDLHSSNLKRYDALCVAKHLESFYRKAGL